MIGLDGRPVQKSLRQMFEEWIEFRQGTIKRRSQYRLDKVLDRIHILEGRQLVLLNIDEVIAIIRHSDEPKAALIARFWGLASADGRPGTQLRAPRKPGRQGRDPPSPGWVRPSSLPCLGLVRGGCTGTSWPRASRRPGSWPAMGTGPEHC